jgi:hypothetical protein
MLEEPPNSDISIEELGIRHIEGYYNLGSGKLEEALVEVNGSRNPVLEEGKEAVWYEVSYKIDLGTAKVMRFPEVSNPDLLGNILARSDLAIAKIEPVNVVQPWHHEYEKLYSELDSEELEKYTSKKKKEDIGWFPDSDEDESG